MDDQQAGTAFRAIRIRKRWRQDDLATKAHVSIRCALGRIERSAETDRVGRAHRPSTSRAVIWPSLVATRREVTTNAHTVDR